MRIDKILYYKNTTFFTPKQLDIQLFHDTLQSVVKQLGITIIYTKNQ